MKEETNNLNSLQDLDSNALTPEEMEQFECQRCGRCCRWPGYVRITDDEADKIAEFLGLEPREFIEKYTTLTADRRGLTILEKENKHCIFYQENPTRCLINDVKPQQCISFPRQWNFPRWHDVCKWGIKHQESKKPKVFRLDPQLNKKQS